MAAQNRNCKVKRLALMGLLFALAMALSFLESLLPALPMLPPGIRLGLSNIVTMYALFVLGPVSVFGGAAHNMGQLIAARFIISNQYVWYYLPVLLAAGLLMGAITGMALRVVMPYLDRLSLK